MIEIIPAIDVIEGKCVRLTRGDFEKKKVYDRDPLDIARRYEDAALKRLHLVDLDGARQGKIVNYRVLEKLAAKTALAIDFGGGINSDDDLRIAFECGARQASIGSIAVTDQEKFLRWVKLHGESKIILNADVEKERVKIRGWQEESKLFLLDLLDRCYEGGVRRVLCTDVSKDGTLEGPNFDLYKKVLDTYEKIFLIASGGVANMHDLEKLDRLGVHAVVVGKALLEGKITLDEIKSFLQG